MPMILMTVTQMKIATNEDFVDDNPLKGGPFICRGRLESCDFRKSRVFPHEGRPRSNGEVLILKSFGYFFIWNYYQG